MARRRQAPRDPGRERSKRAITAARPGVFIAALLACGACCAWATTPVAAAAPLRASHRAKEPNGEDPQLPGTIEAPDLLQLLASAR